MITYIYDEKEKTLHIKIYLLIEHVPHKPSEEELRKVLQRMLKDYADIVAEGKEKLIDGKEWGLW